MQTFEALISNVTKYVDFLVYYSPSLGSFRRRGGEWIVDVESYSGQFDDTEIVDLSFDNAEELLKKWDNGEIKGKEDLKPYMALKNESE